jgi:integrase
MARNSQKMPKISISQKGKYMLRLRFSYRGKKHEITVPRNDNSWNKASETAAIIRSYIKLEIFDETLVKYKLAIGSKTIKRSGVLPPPAVVPYVRLFEIYLEERGYLSPDLATNSEYACYRMLKKWSIETPDDIRTNYLKMDYAPSTFSVRLVVMKKYCEYLVLKGFIKENPMKLVKWRKRYPHKTASREPLPDHVLLETLQALKEDRFKNPIAYFKDSTYYPPLFFMLHTGCRTQEAVGLRVKYVRFDTGLIQIREVLAKKRSLSSNKNLMRKQPKTASGIRDIPVDNSLLDLLKGVCMNKKPDDLVFTSPTRLAVDPRRMSVVWKKYLTQLGHPPMDLYGFRHAFGTRWNEQGLNPVDGAEKMGHADIAVFFNTYAHKSRGDSMKIPKIKGKDDA